MATNASPRILTINTGSSSLKLAIFEFKSDATRILSARAERIGIAGARMQLTDARGSTLVDEQRELPDHGVALEAVLAWLRANRRDFVPDAMGHRVVHGGIRYYDPERITPQLVAELENLIPLDPDHLPQAVQTIKASLKSYPDILQVACFDTAFHRNMPKVARQYPLPRDLADMGVIRYGFHGLSYEYIVQELQAIAPKESAGRVVIAHLGNGASMAAVRGGVGVDTTMGFTPTGGLMMGTRCGDLDPGVVVYLLEQRRISPAALSDLVNRQSGLLGVSESSADMRDLLAKETNDERAAEAIALFCYVARKHLGALAAVLGGLDALVFTGGIGEHAPVVRQRICDGLEFLGVQLDAERNKANADVISAAGGAVSVRVMPTDEDLMIARHTRRMLERF